ncbi:MAG: site-specific DNA-methyltransferase [Candidatus Nitrotoga sp.]|nr:site-specific DNA-methyltransferase [Candidatus Nitrotoga sp.]
MTPEQRKRLIEILLSGSDVAPEWTRIMFPSEKREYELVYHGKDREEDIIANTLAVPLQPVRTFNKNGVEWHNKLIFGDNLQAMKTLLEMKRRGELCNADGTPGVRMIYIDPPFATQREFSGSQEQKAYQDRVAGSQFIEFIRKRLVFLRELLSDDGSLYVHLDWKKSHYIKILLDEIFREVGFQNEVVWHYSGWNKHLKSNFNRRWESIFYYSKNQTPLFNSYALPWESKEAYVKARKQEVHKDRDGKEYVLSDAGNGQRVKRYLHEALEMGRPIDDVWDIDKINNSSNEHTGYPTQKPEALLDRIINASSRKGDLVLDAFAGSGTTCVVAEKLGRRWIGIDCGKFSIYTIQKRLLNLKSHIGNKGASLKTKPFTLYNAGLYDFARLKDLPWADWRRFALTLFGCQDEPQRIGGIQFDGTLKACPVQVFDHRQQGGATITEDTLRSMHEAAGSKIGTRMFIIAPSLAFDFQQDYIQIDDVRYYALRIPYSIIHELHQRDFLALKQPTDEMAVNDTVDAVGFDFIKTPELDYAVGRGNPEGELLEEAFIRIKSFYSEAVVREPIKKRGNRETLSMAMLDYDYDAKADVFDLDEVFYAGVIEAAGWEVRFPANRMGERIMAVLVDIYGNEARLVIPSADFAPGKPGKTARAAKSSAQKSVKKAIPAKTKSKKI